MNFKKKCKCQKQFPFIGSCFNVKKKNFCQHCITENKIYKTVTEDLRLLLLQKEVSLVRVYNYAYILFEFLLLNSFDNNMKQMK